MSTKTLQIEKDKKYSSILDKPGFNSKLFINLDIDRETDEFMEISENNTDDSDDPCELEEKNCLSNELIEELDFSNANSKLSEEQDNKINNINKNVNIVDSLLSLAKKGYEFKPKNFYSSNDKSLLFNKNINKNYYVNPVTKNNNIYLLNKIRANNLRDKKNDWICSNCNNLNFSFRTKCNRCKIKKEDSDRKKYLMKMNFVV